MNIHNNRLTAVFISLGLLTLLVSCGGSGVATDNTSAKGTGSVGILLTDQPADPDMFSAINASIEKVELIGSDDIGNTTLYSGEPKTFDLLKLRNEAVPFTFKDDVPAGEYCKIRLTLSDLELVLADDTPNDAIDNETYHPHLPGNGKLDLLARDCFQVAANEVVTLQLDIDAGKSIHVIENKKGFNFRPVVFVDVLNQEFDAKLVRLQGIIKKTDNQQYNLLLCEAIPTQIENSMGCVYVHLGKEAGFFDNVDYAGTPRALTELLSEDKVGQEVTIIGWPRYWVKPHIDVDIPEGHYPALGDCRIWEINLEPGQQPAPIDCEDLPEILPENSVVVTHEGVEKYPYHPLMALDALAVELGKFLQVEGQVVVDADLDGFEMSISNGGPIISDDTLGVMFQPGDMDINGTRFVTKSGDLINPDDINEPLPVQVDGTLLLIENSDPVLKATLVILDESTLGTEQVTGSILALGTSTLTLSPDTDTVCGVSTVQLEVGLDADVEILTVTITSTGSEIVPGGSLVVGQTVGMNGRCETSGYQTDNVVIVDDQR